MKRILLVAGVLAVSALPFAVPAQAQTSPPLTGPVPEKLPEKPAASYTTEDLKKLGEGVAFPYERLDTVLTKWVDDDGDVFYAHVKGNNDLDIFCRAVAVADLSKFPQWPEPANPDDPKSKPGIDQRPVLTFWINAYNGLFVKAVADAYPVNSVKAIPGLDTAKTRVVAGKSYSFADMRRIMANIDPRAVFALTDGTRMGPRLVNMAYRYFGLNNRLGDVARYFINDPARVKVPSRSNEAVEVSPWLEMADQYLSNKRNSRRKYEGIRAALAGYTDNGSNRNYFTTTDVNIKFLDSDGGLNEQLSKN